MIDNCKEPSNAQEKTLQLAGNEGVWVEKVSKSVRSGEGSQPECAERNSPALLSGWDMDSEELEESCPRREKETINLATIARYVVLTLVGVPTALFIFLFLVLNGTMNLLLYDKKIPPARK